MSGPDISGYLRLIRFPYHVTFASVILGAFVSRRAMTSGTVLEMVLLYLTFNLLLYGGIYTMNAVADVESDRRHPLKRQRPLPSGAVGLKQARLFSLALICGGMIGSFILFSRSVFIAHLAALALNVFYTFRAKHIVYLEIIANSVTHPLRLLLGALLVGGTIPIAFLLAFFFFAFGLAVLRRIVEREVDGWQARAALAGYSGRALFLLRLSGLLALLPFIILDSTVPFVCYLSMIVAYIMFVLGTNHLGPVKCYFVRIWTR
jgi:decaprenyl-phosphate phosphoribosyltransferase